MFSSSAPSFQCTPGHNPEREVMAGGQMPSVRVDKLPTVSTRVLCPIWDDQPCSDNGAQPQQLAPLGKQPDPVHKGCGVAL